MPRLYMIWPVPTSTSLYTAPLSPLVLHAPATISVPWTQLGLSSSLCICSCWPASFPGSSFPCIALISLLLLISKYHLHKEAFWDDLSRAGSLHFLRFSALCPLFLASNTFWNYFVETAYSKGAGNSFFFSSRFLLLKLNTVPGIFYA